VTLGSELREAWEGLGGAWITRAGLKLEDMMESERGGDDDDLGDGDHERLTPSLALTLALARSLECRLPVGGFTNFEKKPGAICLSQPSDTASVIHHSNSAFSANSLDYGVAGDVDIVHECVGWIPVVRVVLSGYGT